ncbi:MAG: hypothetical protein V4721_10210 [Bacteroidota bacterium]
MERPTCKDKAMNAYVDHIEAKLKKFTTNPYCDPYITLKTLVDSGNQKMRKLDIDFMSEEAEKVMVAIEKFADKQKKYAEQLEFFKNKMTPPERKDVEAQMEENAGIAEKMALKNKNG